MTSSLELKKQLTEKNQQFHGKETFFGRTFLSYPSHASAMRLTMFTSHIQQSVVLQNPEFPKVFTHYENITGDYSTGYYDADRNYVVHAKIVKYPLYEEHSPYALILYNKNDNHYDIVFKNSCEDLTERFGFSYNTDVIDSKEVGSKVSKNERLYKSTSYDEYNNYCYGLNAKVVYMVENYTIEDAIVCSESFANNRMVSTEVEKVTVSLNDNDILCNLYGNSDNYKSFPNIGESIVSNMICAKRRIYNNQLFFDMKKSNLRKFNPSNDIPFYNSGTIVDIDIFCNKTLDELPDTLFNKQLREYVMMQRDYYTRLYEICQEIMDSGASYSDEVSAMCDRARSIIDDNIRWKDDNQSVFSNMVIEFLVERRSPLTIGQKLAGRYGNKGVVSKIVPDDQMPYLENGERAEIILNALGVINRLNPMQIFEVSINYINNRVVERLATFTTLKEKESLFFDLMKRYNSEYAQKIKDEYIEYTTKDKKAFFETIQKEGIFVHIPPMWAQGNLFDIVKDIYADYTWLEFQPVYVNKWGRKIQLPQTNFPILIAEEYIIKLKQSSKKGFSARSTGALSKRGVPEKSFKNKAHQDLYSTTPIRIGDQESNNSVIGVEPDIIAEMHMMYRSSVIARRDLGDKLVTTNKPLKDFPLSSKYTNRNVEILQALLKAMGYKITYFGETYDIPINSGDIQSFDCDDGLFIGTSNEHSDYMKKRKIEKKYEEDVCFIGTVDEYDELVNKEYERLKLDDDYYVIDTE